MFKNTASQKITFLVIDTATNVPKTGDAANLTAYVSIDDGAVTALTDTSATELSATNAPGLYTFDCTQAETNGDKLVFSGKSSTSGVRVVPVMVYTLPASFTGLNVSNVNTLASHDPGTTLGTSTLTQAQITGGAYAINSASFAFNAALDFTTTQKAATIARVTLTDTVTTYTGNTPQTGDSFARIGANGAGLTALAPAATALSTATWTALRAGYLDNLSGGPVALASGVTVASINADAINASALASSAAVEIAGAVWDLATTGHTTGGTFGAAMVAAGSAGDPWATSLPGSYTAGTAGYIVGTYINATISSRSTYSGSDTSGTTTLLARLTSTRAGYLDNLSGGAVALASTLGSPTNLGSGATIAANLVDIHTHSSAVDSHLTIVEGKIDDILVDTGATLPGQIGAVAISTADILEDTGTTLPATLATLQSSVSSLPSATAIADATLSRNVSNVESSAPEHSLCTIVLASLESSISGTTWTIKRTNGSTTHATKTVTVDAAADPITGVS